VAGQWLHAAQAPVRPRHCTQALLQQPDRLILSNTLPRPAARALFSLRLHSVSIAFRLCASSGESSARLRRFRQPTPDPSFSLPIVALPRNRRTGARTYEIVVLKKRWPNKKLFLAARRACSVYTGFPLLNYSYWLLYSILLLYINI